MRLIIILFQMEALARKILRRPLEITVGGRSVVCNDVEQHVEVRAENTKFHRLLEILGQWYIPQYTERCCLILKIILLKQD